jgi:cytoskeletal protein CcmA (bactofilin family)/DNA-directed RNA polymerase subunit RPC12/RpoP
MSAGWCALIQPPVPAELFMPQPIKETVEVACPQCGHRQQEPRRAYSTICKNCQQHFGVQEALRPRRPVARAEIERRRVRCFQCGTELDVPKAASSTMCRRCSCHIDLADYHVTQTVSKNFRTHGRLIIEEKGYVLNTEALVGEALIKGRLIGRLAVEGILEIHSSARIRGTFTAGQLVVPLGHQLRWPNPLRVGDADISGELVASVCAGGLVRLRSSARCFGDVEAGNLIVEAGAVFVGSARVGHPNRVGP